MKMTMLAGLYGLLLVPLAADAEIVVTAARGPVVETSSTTGMQISVSELERLPTGRNFSEIAFTTPKAFAQGSRVGVTPEDWRCETRKNTFTCSGSPQTFGYFSLESATGVVGPDRVDVEIMSGSERLFRERVSVGPAVVPPVTVSLEGILSTPGRLTPGGYISVAPLDPFYSVGDWQLYVDSGSGPEPAESYDFSALGTLDERAEFFARNTMTFSERLQNSFAMSYRYRNPFGQVLVDAPLTNYAITGPSEKCTPQIYGCQQRISAGGSICVCGCFPSPVDWLDLRVDGKPVGAPSAASPYMMRIPLPDIEPGSHVLSWVSGSGGSGSLQFEAVRVAGSIANEEILRGNSTDLTFSVLGSQALISMDVETPSDNILLQGGNTQTGLTSGGDPNKFVRRLHGLQVGTYDVNFSIDLPECPCAPVENEPDDLVQHPMQLTGNTNLRSLDTGLEFPIDFSTRNFVAYTPRPPLNPDNIFMRVSQLDLEGRVGGLPPFTFQTRSDAESGGTFRDVRLDSSGRFVQGDIDLTLRADFSVDYNEGFALKPGLEYSYEMSDWSFSGSSPGIGSISYEPTSEVSSVRFSEIRTNRSKTALFGYADFDLKARLRFDGLQELADAEWAQPSAATFPTDLFQAVQQGWVDVGYNGLGARTGDILDLELTRLLSHPFPLTIPSGTVFEPEDPANSRMRVDEDVLIDLGARTNRVRVKGSSLDADLAVPSGAGPVPALFDPVPLLVSLRSSAQRRAEERFSSSCRLRRGRLRPGRHRCTSRRHRSARLSAPARWRGFPPCASRSCRKDGRWRWSRRCG